MNEYDDPPPLVPGSSTRPSQDVLFGQPSSVFHGPRSAPNVHVSLKFSCISIVAITTPYMLLHLITIKIEIAMRPDHHATTMPLSQVSSAMQSFPRHSTTLYSQQDALPLNLRGSKARGWLYQTWFRALPARAKTQIGEAGTEFT